MNLYEFIKHIVIPARSAGCSLRSIFFCRRSKRCNRPCHKSYPDCRICLFSGFYRIFNLELVKKEEMKCRARKQKLPFQQINFINSLKRQQYNLKHILSLTSVLNEQQIRQVHPLSKLQSACHSYTLLYPYRIRSPEVPYGKLLCRCSWYR